MIRRFQLRGGSYCAEARALFARMTTSPTTLRKKAINKLIVALKVAGIWSKTDAFYVLAAADEQASLLNWKSTSYNLTKTGSPAFEADRGFTGSLTGSPNLTDYLRTGFTPSTAGGHFQQDDGALWGWSRTASVSAGIIIGGLFPNSTVRPLSSGSMTGGINSSGGSTFGTVPDGSGLFSVSRTGATDVRGYRNGSLVGTSTQSTSGILTSQIILLGQSQGGSFTGNWNGQCAAGGISAGLNGSEELALYNALLTYMQTVDAA